VHEVLSRFAFARSGRARVPVVAPGARHAPAEDDGTLGYAVAPGVVSRHPGHAAAVAALGAHGARARALSRRRLGRRDVLLADVGRRARCVTGAGAPRPVARAALVAAITCRAREAERSDEAVARRV